MDDMQIPDILIATKYINFSEVISWDQTRRIMLYSVMPYLKQKKITADEFFPLPTDENYHEHEEMTTELDTNALNWFKAYKENYKGQQ